MCGLVSVIAKNQSGFWKVQQEIFHELLFLDTLRGEDSTGVFLADNRGDLTILKEAQQAPVFQQSKEYGDIMRDAFSRGRAMVGHNRKATRGTINDENAHPFIVDDRIVLVHNGTLYGDFKKLAGDGNDVEVDSHAIAHLIHKHEDNVEAALQEINGAYALIWWDMKAQTLNFVRNDQRPLHFLETDNSILWASEHNMLEWIRVRHDLKTENKTSPLKAGCLVTYHLKDMSPLKVTIRDVKLTKPAYSYNYQGNHVHQNHHNAEYYNKDACAYSPLAWGDEGDGEEVIGAEKITDITRSVVERAANSEDAAIKQMNRSSNGKQRSDEERLAINHACQITMGRFETDTYSCRDGNLQKACLVDFEYVNGIDKEHGYFLYGLITTNGVQENILAKIYVPPSEREMTILDWATNGTVVTFTQNAKIWRPFIDRTAPNRHGNGYGMITGKNATELIQGEGEKNGNTTAA